MAITESQIQEAKEKIQAVAEQLFIINEVVGIVERARVYKDITLTSSQKQALLDKYEVAKTEIKTAVNNLL